MLFINRIGITWPETAFYVTTTYDALNRPTAIKELGTTNLASYAYDDLSRRTTVTLGNSTTTSYAYSTQSALATLTHNLTGTAQDQTYTYTRNQVQEITGQSWTNDSYQWTGYTNGTKSYTANGLNQYTAAAGATLTHDTKGNLTGDGVWTYTYDLDNQLISANKTGSTNSLAYDGAGRLRQTTLAGTITGLTYDGVDLVAEYNSGGTLLRRYVHGPGVDEPLVWYEGTTTTNKTWLYQDQLGSVIGTANSAGTSTAIHSYGPYGEPNIATGIRFRYTGQQFLGSLNLYYYKARFYSPALGRFLQTDPIGTADDLNLYAYVGNNPINFSDPSGLTAAAASMLLGKVGSTSADQFALGFIPGYDLYSASQNPNATMLDYGVGVLGILPGMGKGAGIGIRAADNLVGAVARGLPDSALVCRGGTCTADRFISGSGVSLDASGKLQGVSVNSAAGKTVEQLSVGIPNKQIGVTTVGDVRQAGGDVIPSPTVENPYHCTLCGVTPQQAEQLMTPAIKNPN